MKTKGMKIRTRITLLTTILICVVVAGIAMTLIWVQQRQLREDFMARIDAMMNGVDRIAQESLKSGDEIMLLSYLKHLMKEYPELELCLVSRTDHTSVLGEIRTELYYRTITVTESKAAEYKTDEKAFPLSQTESVTEGKISSSGRSIPPGMLMVQVGLSKTALERQIHQAGISIITKVLGTAGIGLVLGLFGSWLVSRRLARPIVSLAARIQSVAEGQHLDVLEVQGDEIAYLRNQYENLSMRIMEFIRFKEELLMTLTHELNNPLSGLKALIAMIRDSAVRHRPKEMNETYKIMADAVNAMELSLSNALELFKTGSKPALKLEKIKINDILDWVFRLFKPVAQSNKINFEEPDISETVYLYVDEELIRRVIINLVSNACKYTMSGGSVRIGLKVSADSVNISVADTGPGIAPGDRELIFTKFYRSAGPDGKARRIPGSGLGLAIAKQAVELHNGKIWVESEKGKGSVFYVSLPRTSALR